MKFWGKHACQLTDAKFKGQLCGVTSLWSGFFPSTFAWMPGIELRLSGLCGKYFHAQSQQQDMKLSFCWTMDWLLIFGLFLCFIYFSALFIIHFVLLDTESHCVAQDGFKLTAVLLPLSFKCWDHSTMLSSVLYYWKECPEAEHLRGI